MEIAIPQFSKEDIILCKICDEMITQADIETHSKICAANQEVQIKKYNCDLRLQKLKDAIVLWKSKSTLDSPLLKIFEELKHVLEK